MIQVGMRVQWSDSKLAGSVSAVHDKEFDVIWDNSEGHTSRGLGYWLLVQRKPSTPYIQVVPPAPVTPQPITLHQFDRAMVMAKNIGRMEGTIEILFNRINRMRKGADLYGHVNTVADLDAMLETITRCAERIEDLPSVSGNPTVSQLKIYIAGQK